MKYNLMFSIEILLMGWLMVQPVTISNSQDTSVKQQPSIQSLKQEGEILKGEMEKKQEKFVKVVSEPSPAKAPRKVYRVKKVVKEVLASDQEILLRVNGKNIYKTDPELYQGNVIIDIDLDSLQRDMEIVESLIDKPVNVIPITPAPDTTTHKRSHFQNVIDFLQFWKAKGNKNSN